MSNAEQFSLLGSPPDAQRRLLSALFESQTSPHPQRPCFSFLSLPAGDSKHLCVRLELCLQNCAKTDVMSSLGPAASKRSLFAVMVREQNVLWLNKKVPKTSKGLYGGIPIITVQTSLSHCSPAILPPAVPQTPRARCRHCSSCPGPAGSPFTSTKFAQLSPDPQGLHTWWKNSHCPKLLLYSFVHRK